MKKILVLRTSADNTMNRLFNEIKGNDVYCMIQSSIVKRYSELHPEVKYIDIKREGFYDIDQEIISGLKKVKFDEVYVTFTGVIAHNYGNVMTIVEQLNYKKAFFYNCNGERTEIPKFNVVKDFLCRVFIKICEVIY